MRVILGRQLQFPSKITTTFLRPDIVVWSTEAKAVLIIELTVPSEEGIEAAIERKKTMYSELAAEYRESGWKITIYTVKVGWRGFMGLSTTQLLRDAGVTRGKLKKAPKALAEDAEKGSFWLWLTRKATVGERTPNPDASCRGGRETSLSLLRHQETFQDERSENVEDWCFLADDPAAGPVGSGGGATGSNVQQV